MGNKNSRTNRRKKTSTKSAVKCARSGEAERVGQPSYCRRWNSRPLRRCQSDNPINYELIQQCGVQQLLCPPSQRPTLGPPPNMMQPPFNPRPCSCAQNNQEMPSPIPCNCPRPIPCNCDQQTQQPQQKLMACCCVIPVPVHQSMSAPRPRSYSQPQPRQRSYSQPRNTREVHFAPLEDQSRCSLSSITLSIDCIPCYNNSHGRSNSSYYPLGQYESDPSLNDDDSMACSCCSSCSSGNSGRSVTFADNRRSRRSCFRCFQKRKNRSPKYNPR